MGLLDSLPFISQVKSLVQVIGGDTKGALETQKQFAETGIIVSQVNSAVQSIQGNHKEAKIIQEKFAQATYESAQGIPIVGHGIAAGHAIAGDNAEAERIALVSTKSTVTAMATAAGAVCGPGAPACAATFAVASSTGWDAAESGIKGEKVGSIKSWDNLVKGKADLGEGIDLIGGHVLEAAGAAKGVGALKSKIRSGAGALKSKIKSGAGALKSKIKSGAGALKSKMKSGSSRRSPFQRGRGSYRRSPFQRGRGSYRRSPFQRRNKYRKVNSPRCKRSVIMDENLIYDANLNDIPENLMHRLPGSVSNITLAEDMAPASLVDSALSLIFILKLMSIGHIKSKIYYGEMCSGLYPHLKIEECSIMLHNALAKFAVGKDVSVEDLEDNYKQDKALLLADLLDGLQFEIKSLSKKTIIGHFLEVAACKIADLENELCTSLMNQLKDGLREIDGFVNQAGTKRRVKRCLACGGLCNHDGTQSFREKHTPAFTRDRGDSLGNNPNTIYTEQNWNDYRNNRPTSVRQQEYRDGVRTGFEYHERVMMRPITDPITGQIIHVDNLPPPAVKPTYDLSIFRKPTKKPKKPKKKRNGGA